MMNLAGTYREEAMSIGAAEVGTERASSVSPFEIQRWKWYEYAVLGLWYAILIGWLVYFFSLA